MNINTRPGAKFPPNLTFHARRQAKIRGITLDRLTWTQQEDWKASTGFDNPPRWVMSGAQGKVIGYYYTLHDVLKDLEQRPIPTTAANFT